MRSKAMTEMVKNIPLKTRLKVSTEMAFINLISELGYRENKMWTEDEDHLLNKLCVLAEKFSTDQIKEFEQWQKDGKP
jgi:hypothetical protein